MGLASICIYKGDRITAASAYLSNPPSNLTIITDALVAKVLFESKRATGVQISDGREFRAHREVVLSGGALNTPQVLLLSGVGPADELTKHGIPITLDLPNVGRNLQVGLTNHDLLQTYWTS